MPLENGQNSTNNANQKVLNDQNKMVKKEQNGQICFDQKSVNLKKRNRLKSDKKVK